MNNCTGTTDSGSVHYAKSFGERFDISWRNYISMGNSFISFFSLFFSGGMMGVNKSSFYNNYCWGNIIKNNSV